MAQVVHGLHKKHEVLTSTLGQPKKSILYFTVMMDLFLMFLIF
jgi:hypothetical protein